MKRSPRPRTPSNLSGSLHRQLNSYVLAASAAGVGALAFSQPVEAKIVYTPAHDTLQQGGPVALDLNYDGIVDFYLLQRGLIHINFSSFLSACQNVGSFTNGLYCSSTRGGTNGIRAIDSNGNQYAAALRYGKTIQQGERFAPASRGVKLGGVRSDGQSNTFWFGPWLNGGKGVKNRYLGLKFKIKGQFHFGWARISTSTSKKRYTTTLTGYAYETIPGKAIIAGKTQGPDVIVKHSMLGELALGRK